MMEQEKKKGWGGARPGAGRKVGWRKPNKKTVKAFTVRCDPTFVDRVKETAKNEGVAIGEWLEQHINF